MKIFFNLNKLVQKVSLRGIVFANIFLFVSSIYFLIDKFGNIFTLDTLNTNAKVNIIVAIVSIIINSIAIRSGYNSELLINNNMINPNIVFVMLLILNTLLLSSLIVFLKLDMSRLVLYGPIFFSAIIVPLIMRLFRIND